MKLTDERQRKLESTSAIVAEDDLDDPPMSVVIDAALENLIEHEQNLDDTRGELPPETIQRFNTSVVGLRYRTSIESRYR
ncbi:DUF7386 family protein [Natrinema thermotolerans]|uniref:DUF7386 family protein n=1 Tax=Natrinema thermotolerans TaxID=121872 RepID=UPI0031F324F9